MLKSINKSGGFTLVELMVVIVIIVILASLSAISYVIIANQTADSKLQAAAEQIQAGISHRQSATYNVVPDRGTTTRAEFMKQYQINDIDADVNVRYERYGCQSAISDSCSTTALSQEKINFYVSEEPTAAGQAGDGAARIIYWSSDKDEFIMTKVSYDDGEASTSESQLAEGSTWSDAY